MDHVEMLEAIIRMGMAPAILLLTALVWKRAERKGPAIAMLVVLHLSYCAAVLTGYAWNGADAQSQLARASFMAVGLAALVAGYAAPASHAIRWVAVSALVPAILFMAPLTPAFVDMLLLDASDGQDRAIQFASAMLAVSLRLTPLEWVQLIAGPAAFGVAARIADGGNDGGMLRPILRAITGIFHKAPGISRPATAGA